MSTNKGKKGKLSTEKLCPMAQGGKLCPETNF